MAGQVEGNPTQHLPLCLTSPDQPPLPPRCRRQGPAHCLAHLPLLLDQWHSSFEARGRGRFLQESLLESLPPWVCYLSLLCFHGSPGSQASSALPRLQGILLPWLGGEVPGSQGCGCSAGTPCSLAQGWGESRRSTDADGYVQGEGEGVELMKERRGDGRMMDG